ncbi:hypothetical protein BD413DRAFT_615470 [Trametes elegans]|nr:hypothetical protein BD413DRAFT_615470 [Trametes elegans]
MRGRRGQPHRPPLCEASPEEDDGYLLVGTRTDVCFDCKRYYRTWELAPQEVAALHGSITTPSLDIRRNQRTPTPLTARSDALPMRIRWIVLQAWCKNVLAAQRYEAALRRTPCERYSGRAAGTHVLTIRYVRSQPLCAPELEVSIVQELRIQGVVFAVRQKPEVGADDDSERSATSEFKRALHSPLLAVPATEPASELHLDAQVMGCAPQSCTVPFTGSGLARGEFELRSILDGREDLFQTLRITLKHRTTPTTWTYSAWGQAPQVNLWLAVELSKPRPLDDR